MFDHITARLALLATAAMLAVPPVLAQSQSAVPGGSTAPSRDPVVRESGGGQPVPNASPGMGSNPSPGSGSAFGAGSYGATGHVAPPTTEQSGSTIKGDEPPSDGRQPGGAAAPPSSRR